MAGGGQTRRTPKRAGTVVTLSRCSLPWAARETKCGTMGCPLTAAGRALGATTAAGASGRGRGGGGAGARARKRPRCRVSGYPLGGKQEVAPLRRATLANRCCPGGAHRVGEVAGVPLFASCLRRVSRRCLRRTACGSPPLHGLQGWASARGAPGYKASESKAAARTMDAESDGVCAPRAFGPSAPWPAHSAE